MSQFKSDKSDEEVVVQNLEEHQLLGSLFEEYRKVSSLQRQKNGVDVVATYDSEVIDVDIKSQIDYINNPKWTFVLEIFSETSRNSRNRGWFIDDSIDTDYYLLTWLPTVDEFEVEHCLNAVRFYPGAPSFNFPDFMSELERNKKYGFQFSQIDRFCRELYDIDMNFFLNQPSNQRFYTASSIRTHHTVLVKKKKIERYLNSIGLTRSCLIEDAKQVQKTGETIQYDDLGEGRVYAMFKTNRGHESPVNLVVDYDLYRELSDSTLTLDSGEVQNGLAGSGKDR
jgi:hypothetical protein